MFKNIEFYIKTRHTRGVRVFFCHSKNVTYSNSHSACMIKSSFVTENKRVKLHMRVFEITITITSQC